MILPLIEYWPDHHLFRYKQVKFSREWSLNFNTGSISVSIYNVAGLDYIEIPVHGHSGNFAWVHCSAIFTVFVGEIFGETNLIGDYT